jgi:Protein of unknown function (DUF998)
MRPGASKAPTSDQQSYAHGGRRGTSSRAAAPAVRQLVAGGQLASAGWRGSSIRIEVVEPAVYSGPASCRGIRPVPLLNPRAGGGMTPRTTPHRTERATGASLTAILLVLGCFGAMVVLHMVRTDLDPVRQVMSEYANGRFGWFMTAAFYAMGLACVALAVRLGRAIVRRRLSVAVRALLGLGGLGLILAGVFEVERPAVPDTSRRSSTATPH